MAREASTHVRVSRETRDRLQEMLNSTHQQCDSLEGVIVWLIEHEDGKAAPADQLKPLQAIKGSTLPALRTTAAPANRSEREVTPMFKKGKKE